MLWTGPFGGDPTRWWVWRVEIERGKRGLGRGRQAMKMAADMVSAQGAVSLGVSLCSHNSVARHLDGSLACTKTSAQLRKDLRPSR